VKIVVWVYRLEKSRQTNKAICPAIVQGFVVETTTEKLIVEIKALRDMGTETVQAKSKAVATWVGYATRHAAVNGGNPWRYLLVPHDRMTESASVGRIGCVVQYFGHSTRRKRRGSLLHGSGTGRSRVGVSGVFPLSDELAQHGR
jgi:hypothetical protein